MNPKHDSPTPAVLRKAWDISPAAILVTNPEGCIEYVNPAFERLSGYSFREVAGKNPRILKSGAHPPEFYVELWKTISSGNAWTGRMKNRRKDGSGYWADMTIAPVTGGDGRTLHYVAAKENVTATNDFAEVAEKFFEQPLSLNLICGLDGVVKQVNEGWTLALGYSRSDLEGRPFLDLVHPDDLERTIRETENVGQGLGLIGFENRYRHKNGTYRTLRWSSRTSPGTHLI